jgi:Spy/CpxP family protein refolding chaperone
MKQQLRMMALLVGLFMAAGTSVAGPQQQGLPGQNGSVTGIVRIPAGAKAQKVAPTLIRVAAVRRPESSGAGPVGGTLVSLARIDAEGRYVLENIPPGQYLIAAGPIDRPMYFPETLTDTVGVVVSVTAGATVAGVDLDVRESSGLRAVRAPFDTRQDVISPFGIVQGQRTGGPPAPTGVPGARGRGGRGGATTNTAAWWTNPALVARLGLTDEQKAKIEMIFEKYRNNLNSRIADLDREEGQLARMLEADPLEPAKVVQSQIDRVIQARAEMEKTYAGMSLEIRQTMTGAQWAQLQREVPQASLTPSQSGAAPSVGLPVIRRAFPDVQGERGTFRIRRQELAPQ